jgi:hypothetical protein
VLPSRLAKLSRLLESRNCDAEALREQVWGGVPARYRTAVWQMLLGYLPLNRERQADSLARKRAEYQALVDQFCGPRAAGSAMSDAEQTVLRQVLYDAKRTNPEVPLFHTEFVQRSLERVLFVYSQRHFATGYVQGESVRGCARERPGRARKCGPGGEQHLCARVPAIAPTIARCVSPSPLRSRAHTQVHADTHPRIRALLLRHQRPSNAALRRVPFAVGRPRLHESGPRGAAHAF